MEGGEVKKKYSRKGKLDLKKIHAPQLTLKNMWHVARKFPTPPPHNVMSQDF